MALDFTDIIDSVKTRFSNPFFGTYAVTFLFVNWHIPVGLLMLSKEDINELGYGNWVEFIDYHLSFSKGVAIPLTLSLVAVIALPFIMSEYKILQAKALNSFNLNQKKHAKDRYIEMEKYLQLWQTYDGKLDQLEVAIGKAELFKGIEDSLNKQLSQNKSDMERWIKRNNVLDKEVSMLNSTIAGLQNVISQSKRETVPDWLDGQFKFESFLGVELGTIKFERDTFEITLIVGKPISGTVQMLHYIPGIEGDESESLTCGSFGYVGPTTKLTLRSMWKFNYLGVHEEIRFTEFSADNIQDFRLSRI